MNMLTERHGTSYFSDGDSIQLTASSSDAQLKSKHRGAGRVACVLIGRVPCKAANGGCEHPLSRSRGGLGSRGSARRQLCRHEDEVGSARKVEEPKRPFSHELRRQLSNDTRKN